MNRKYLRVAALVPLALVLCHCDRVQSLFKAQPPKPTPYDFTFTIDITPEAAAQLKKENADFGATAYFYGLAKPENRAQADEMNRTARATRSRSTAMPRAGSTSSAASLIRKTWP